MARIAAAVDSLIVSFSFSLGDGSSPIIAADSLTAAGGAVNDELGLLAAAIGTLFLMAGRTLADPIAAIAVATIISFNAVGIFRENLQHGARERPRGEVTTEAPQPPAP